MTEGMVDKLEDTEVFPDIAKFKGSISTLIEETGSTILKNIDYLKTVGAVIKSSSKELSQTESKIVSSLKNLSETDSPKNDVPIGNPVTTDLHPGEKPLETEIPPVEVGLQRSTQDINSGMFPEDGIGGVSLQGGQGVSFGELDSSIVPPE